jgi:hypothetical protein
LSGLFKQHLGNTVFNGVHPVTAWTLDARPVSQQHHLNPAHHAANQLNGGQGGVGVTGSSFHDRTFSGGASGSGFRPTGKARPKPHHTRQTGAHLPEMPACERTGGH